MHMLSILMITAVAISLFAETVLHVGQVPMLVWYITNYIVAVLEQLPSLT